VELFEPWGWVIGTGIYYDEINQSISAITKRTNKVLTTIFLTILAISIYILIRNIRLEKKRASIEEERITLIQNLKETNQKLEKTSKELQEANKTKDMFLANISHDLRTPLNGILGFSKLIEEASPEDRQELFDKYVVYIEKSGKYLLNMINDILDLSKMQAGKSEPEKTIFNLNELLSDVIQSLSFFALEKDIELSMNVPEDSSSSDPLFIEADKTMMNKVFYNLLSNAIKFTPEGKKVGITLKENRKNLIIQIWDQGIGIPKEAQKKVFEPFVQLNNIKYTGTGLGLTISEDIIKMHGGSLSLESIEGEGSEFTVSLPASIKPEPIDEEATKQPESIYFSGKHVLIVEDDPISRQFMTLYLKKHGFEVKETDSGQEALALTQQQSFDIILMDIQLPDINGKDLLKKIENLIKDKPFIAALTAYSGEKV
jgi:signal transduction histidine kinase